MVITGMNSPGSSWSQIWLSLYGTWECSHHTGNFPYLPNFCTSSQTAVKDTHRKFLIISSWLTSKEFRDIRKTEKKYSVFTSCLFLKLQECVSSCNGCFINIQGIHLLYPLSSWPVLQQTFPFSEVLVFPFNYFYTIKLCCITVTVLSSYSNVLRADLFLRISLLMFADLFYILVD